MPATLEFEIMHNWYGEMYHETFQLALAPGTGVGSWQAMAFSICKLFQQEKEETSVHWLFQWSEQQKTALAS